MKQRVQMIGAEIPYLSKEFIPGFQVFVLLNLLYSWCSVI
jgi:hypothetical protein